MIWESKTTLNQTNKEQHLQQNQSSQDYTKHYIYEPNSFVPALHTGYSQFIQLIETPDYSQYKTQPYSIHKDPIWRTDTRKNKAELERAVFYHCDQVGTPQALSNEKGECIWEITQSTWGKTEAIKAQNPNQIFEQTNIRFQGQYYDEETGLHYNRYRYYEPHSGRYVSKDPIGLLGGLNNSAYVSDPNQWVDYLGLYGDIAADFAHGPQWSGARQEFGRQKSCYELTGQFCKNELVGTKEAVAGIIRAAGGDYLVCSGNVGGGWGQVMF